MPKIQQRRVGFACLSDCAIRRSDIFPRIERKRALPQPVFGSLLSSLIHAPTPSKPLRPLHPPPSTEAIEKKALKSLQATRHDREERGHVADVIAGWTARPNLPFSQWSRVSKGKASTEYMSGGADKEKELRRLAQKGAVRLFNAIKVAQSTEKTAESATAPTRQAAVKSVARNQLKEASPTGSLTPSVVSSKPSLSIAGSDRNKSNLLGTRGKQEARKRQTPVASSAS